MTVQNFQCVLWRSLQFEHQTASHLFKAFYKGIQRTLRVKNLSSNTKRIPWKSESASAVCCNGLRSGNSLEAAGTPMGDESDDGDIGTNV